MSKSALLTLFILLLPAFLSIARRIHLSYLGKKIAREKDEHHT